MRIPSLVLAAIVGSAVPASASVIVVDPANGPGTAYTSLADAIQAAASGDVLLLRSGTYDGSFVVGGKSLAIFADDGAQVHITNSALGDPAAPALQVGSQVAGTTVLRGLTLSTPAGGGVPLIVKGTSAAGGHVWIEDCNVPSSGGVGMQLANGSPATVSRCNVNGAKGAVAVPSGVPISVASPAVLAGAGPLAVFAGQLSGGRGLDAGLYGPLQTPMPGEDGAPGVQSENVDSSVKLLSTVICLGGPGGAGAAPGGNCLPPGDGGDGLLATLNDNVHVASLYGTGELPGAPAPGCSQLGEFGKLIDSVPPAPLPTWLPGVPVNLVVSAVRREGQDAKVVVFNATSQTVGLLVGFAPQFEYLPKWSGVMVATPEFVVPVGQVGFNGTLSLDVHVPELGPGVEAVIAYVQAFAKDASGHKTVGQPSAVLMLDSQF